MVETTTSPGAPLLAAPAEAPPSGAAPPTPLCRNCGAPASAPFCGQCGQATADRLLSVPDLLSDILEDQLSVNGSAARTVGPLLFRPGFLTEEYLRGRIVRYVAPFRLFLLSTALWLFAGALVLHLRQPQLEASARARYAELQARQKRFPGSPAPMLIRAVPFLDSLSLPPGLRRPGWYLLRKQAELNARGPAGALVAWVNAQQRSWSTLVVLLVPAVAALLKLVYIRRRRLFAEHVVFTMHFHAFAFLALAAGMLLVLVSGSLYGLTMVPIAAYLYLALKRVYGDGWLGTLGHAVALGALYALMLALAMPFVAMLLLSRT